MPSNVLYLIVPNYLLTEGLYSYDAIGRLQGIRKQSQDPLKVEQENAKNKAISSDKQVSGQLDDIGKYVRLGSVGTALYQSQLKKPRVLLIDEIDKSDIDLPNNLLHIFEEGEFEISELARIKKQQPKVTVFTSENDEVEIDGGKISCNAFPFVILTSNGERDFPPPVFTALYPLDYARTRSCSSEKNCAGSFQRRSRYSRKSQTDH